MSNNFNKLIIIVCIYATLGKLALAVRITKFTVPRVAQHDAFLDCAYDLEGQILYDVKWYKDGVNFFRCFPSGEIVFYDEVNVKVTHHKFAPLGACSLTLMMLNVKSAGEYKCEVTIEGPSFQTVIRSSKLRIIEASKRIENRSFVNVNIDAHDKSESKNQGNQGCCVSHYCCLIAFNVILIRLFNILRI